MFDIIFTIKELIARFIEYGVALLSSLHNFEPVNRTICKFLTAVNRVRTSQQRLTLERVVVLIGTTFFFFDSFQPIRADRLKTVEKIKKWIFTLTMHVALVDQAIVTDRIVNMDSIMILTNGDAVTICTTCFAENIPIFLRDF